MVLLDGNLFLSARLSLDFAFASAIILRAVRAACARSANVAREILGLRNDRSERNSLNTSAEDTTPFIPKVSLQALTARLSKNYFFILV